jgi:myosin-5
VTLPCVDDAHDFAATRHAMRSVGLAASDQEQIFRVLAALVHLSDIVFESSKDGESSGVSGAAAASMAAAAELLGCDAAALTKALTTRTRQTPDGPIVSPLPAKAAAEARDALAKVSGRAGGAAG